MTPKLVPFLDIFEDVSGGNVKTPQSEFLLEGNIPVVDQGQELIAGYVTDHARICRATPPVIVFGDHTRIIKYVDFQFAMGADGTKVLASRNGDHPKYLYHALQAIPIPSAGYSRHYKFLKETKIPLPPLAEQKRIAGILDAADALRAKRREAIAQLDALLQSTFLDLFGDPVANPKSWEVRPFEECCEAIFKGAFDLKAECYRAEGIPFIRIADIQNRTISLKDAVYIHEEVHAKYGSSQLTPGDIVFSKVGTIDRIASIPASIPRCNCSQNNVGARLKHELLNVEFALALLTTGSILDRIRAGSKKAVQDKLVLAELRRLPVILPPIEDQLRFATSVASVKLQIGRNNDHLAELDALFASLQSRAFRGEL